MARNTERRSIQLEERDFRGETPLHYAVKSGNKDSIKLLLRNGANPNSADNGGNTPLHLVCKEGRNVCVLGEIFLEIAAELDRPIQIDARDCVGNTPLHCAIECYQNGLIKLLLKRGANPNLIGAHGLTSLQLICAYNGEDRDYDLVKILLDEDLLRDEKNHDRLSQIDRQDERGCTPLLLALQSGSKKTAELLLSRGASPNVADDGGLTPMHVISRNPLYVDVLEMLLEPRAAQRRQEQEAARGNLDSTPSAKEDGQPTWDTIDILIILLALLMGFIFYYEINWK